MMALAPRDLATGQCLSWAQVVMGQLWGGHMEPAGGRDQLAMQWQHLKYWRRLQRKCNPRSAAAAEVVWHG